MTYAQDGSDSDHIGIAFSADGIAWENPPSLDNGKVQGSTVLDDNGVWCMLYAVCCVICAVCCMLTPVNAIDSSHSAWSLL
jgi:hypothetical protein